MAGMLPGVEIHRRRRTSYSQRLHEDSNHGHLSHRSWLEPPLTTTTTTTMDETTLRARRRLEEKLGYFRPSRLNRAKAIEVRANRTMTMSTKDGHDHLVSRMLGRPWHFQINSSESKGQLCVVCLEGFRAEQQVMELSCSHKYHSKCLLPWLAAHPNCPSCRSPVKS